MKCKICGHRSNSLIAMGKHYRQKHPGRMKARKRKSPKYSVNATRHGGYCPHCGERL